LPSGKVNVRRGLTPPETLHTLRGMLFSRDEGAATGGRANPKSARLLRHVPAFLVVVFFSALFGALTASSFDSEVWWHLASGRWMWENRTLLSADPFDFTSVIFGSSGQVRYLFTQYWFAQVLLYESYLLAGLKGVFLLRAAAFTVLFSLLYRLLRLTGAGTLLSSLLVALSFQAIAREFNYVENRPQMWSSLAFVALLLILEHLRGGKRWARFVLPPFMLLWANLHGGYILGIVVIAIAVAAAYLSRHGERRRMLVAAAAAVALAGCNPAGYAALLAYPLDRFSVPARVFEEQSLFRYVSVTALPGARPWLTAVFLLPFLTLVPRLGSLLRERRDVLLIFLLTLGLGIKAQRYLVFLVPLACWVTALNIAALRGRLPQAGPWPLRRRLSPQAWGALTAVVLVMLATSYARVAAHSSALRPSANFRHAAEGAADYLKHNGLRGNVFNEYTLGGYLAWRLSPEMKIFIYGRCAYPELLALYDDIVKYPRKTVSLTATGGVSYFYQKVFDENAVDIVVIPAGDSLSGDAVPLAWMLALDDAWALVYARPAALVFLRKTAAPAHLVGNALPKSEVFDNLIAIASAVSRSGHGRSSPVWRRSLALAHLGKGQGRESLRLFDEYLALAPKDTWAVQMRAVAAGTVGAGAR
jgi:hypothetical protein